VKVGTGRRPQWVADVDGLEREALAACESGGRPGAFDAGGTYGGLYRFDPRTCHVPGGSGRPQDVPVSERTFRAKKLHVQRGAGPWPRRGRRLTG
jgi:resuscitation-promoting factor RpfB